MILPTKHMATNRALIGVGGNILQALSTPKTMSALWDEVRAGNRQKKQAAAIDYKWFVLALDLLFMLGAVELAQGTLQRRAA